MNELLMIIKRGCLGLLLHVAVLLLLLVWAAWETLELELELRLF
jgi:hypothetical protein